MKISFTIKNNPHRAPGANPPATQGGIGIRVGQRSSPPLFFLIKNQKGGGEGIIGVPNPAEGKSLRGA